MKLIFLFIVFSISSFKVSPFKLSKTQSLSTADPKLTPLSQLPLVQTASQTIDFSSFKDALQPYNLTQGETRALFRLCDHNRNDRLTPKEWTTCLTVFISPYESLCLKSPSSYLLSKNDLKACLTKTWFKDIPSKTHSSEPPVDAIMRALLRDSEGQINLMDYVFLRRLTLAWKECSVDGRLNKKRMQCALGVTTPQKRRFLPVANQVFNIAVELYKTKNRDNEAFLDFFSFAKIAYLYYYFNEFELPFQGETLTKKTLLNAIEDQVMPTSLTVEWANRIFYALDPENNGNRLKLDFSGFAGIVHCLRLYNEFAEKRKSGTRFFTEKSFKKMIVEREWDYYTSNLLYSVTVVNEEYKTNELNETALDMNERSYFVRFKRSKRSGAVDKNKIIYKIFDLKGNNNWNFTQLVKFVKLTWAFQLIDLSEQGLIFRNDISSFIGNRAQIIPFSSEELKLFDQTVNTIKNDPINGKQFYTFFIYKQVFAIRTVPGHKRYVTLKGLKAGLEALNLKASKENLAISKEMTSDIQNVAIYDYEKGFLKAIREEIRMIRKQILAK